MTHPIWITLEELAKAIGGIDDRRQFEFADCAGKMVVPFKINGTVFKMHVERLPELPEWIPSS